MEINKQLFEDVLSGKLKGIFVLRDSSTFYSKCLKRTNDTCLLYNKPNYPYALVNSSSACSYTENGKWSTKKITHIDIVDFIPDTNMKENELTIEIPEGKIVDWEESKKQNKIVLKDKQLTYEYICEKLLGGDFYFTAGNGDIMHGTSGYTPNCAKTEHQLECILAKNKLANVALYLNSGWKPGEDDYATLLLLDGTGNIACYRTHSDGFYGKVIFKTNELAQQAVEILGEEIVKLALEPLGI